MSETASALASPKPKLGRGRSVRDPDRQRDDFYRTPARATIALLSVERFEGPIWECACGDGAISEVLKSAGHETVDTDLVDRGYGRARIDFLMETTLIAPNIVTNPPFKLADEFVRHALDLGARKVAIFQRTAFLSGTRRYQTLYRLNPPARVWQFSSRLTLWRGDAAPPLNGGTVDYAWFVWDCGTKLPPVLGWLP